MNEPESVLGAALLGFLRAVGSVLLWTLWLALGLLLVLQIYVATTSELQVPPILRQRLEERLAESGLRATFTSSSLDPEGHVLIEHVRLSLPAFNEPILTARAIYVRLNPWLLSLGRIEPREIRLTGATLTIPAMLASSGAAEELVRDLDTTVQLRGRELMLEQFSTRVAGATLTAHGAIPLPRPRGQTDPRRIAEFLEQRFPTLCRQAATLARELEHFQEPRLELEFGASDSGAPLVHLHGRARSVKWDQPVAFELAHPEAYARVLLLDTASVSRIDMSARELVLPSKAVVRHLRAAAFGRLSPGERTAFEPRSVEATADRVEAFGFAARDVSVLLLPAPLPRVDATLAMNFLGEPVAASVDADFTERTARADFRGRVAPELLGVLGERLRVDIRRYFDFGELDCLAGEARLGPGWKFQAATAQVALTDINAYGVKIDAGRARVEFDGRRFYSPEAFGRLGPNFALGSYEHDLRTRAFRFLLRGRLRPMDISPWFRDWWSDFLAQLEFPPAPPTASVDVTGTWKHGEATSVFVFADAARPVVRGVPLDRVRTRLFIRPTFFDGLELLAQRAAGSAQGRFTFRLNPATRAWSLFEVKADSTFELPLLAQLMQPFGPRLLAPFEVATAPELRVDGRFEGPGAAGGQRHRVRLDARTEGIMRFHHFPLYDVSFGAGITNDEILLDRLEARFGGGTVTAHARIAPLAGNTRVGFDLNLKNASLGQVTAAIDEFMVYNQAAATAGPGKFVQEKAAVRLDLAASGEGGYGQPYTFKGEGHAVLAGAEIGEVPLLGALSELFTFTALRFNSARANFRIQGAQLVFPEIAIRGESSAIDAHGVYALDRRELDFNAKVFPFQESGNLLKSVVGAVLTPLSNALEVKLKGTLQKPQWAFVLGPTSFLRALGQDEKSKPADDTQPAPGGAPPANGAGPVPPATQPPPVPGAPSASGPR